MINIKDFQSNLLKIDKKPRKVFSIYYVGYIIIKEVNDCKNIHSVNPLSLIFNSATGYFKEDNDEKYLILDSTEKYEEVLSEIKAEIETINGGEKMYYEKDDDILLNKKIRLSSLIIIIRCIFQNDKKLCPQIYLDKCLYEL